MSSTNKQNEIHRFMFRNLAVMGNLIVLNSAWQDIIKDRNYSNITKEILGGLTLFSVLFADKMKRDVVLNFQLKAISPVEFVRVEAIKEIAQSFNKENSLFIRGMARSSKNSNENSNENSNKIINENSDNFISDENSYLLMNLMLPNHKQPYQSFVPLVIENKKLNLSKTLTEFLQLSEQQQSYIKIFVSDDFVGGIFLQKMPEENSNNNNNNNNIDEDAFNRLCNFANTLNATELKNLDATEILFRLFNEDIKSLEVFIPENIYYRNNGGYDYLNKITQIIKSMGKEQAFKLLNENAERKIIISDEMSNKDYELTEMDLVKIFNDNFE